MSDQRDDYRNEESPVLSGPAPAPEPEAENQLVTMSLAATLTKAEIDQQISTAHAFPRSPSSARDRMISLATLDDQMAEECIYSVPRGGKQIRGPSIRFAEIVLNSWGNVRCAARVTHEDIIARYVEAEALVHDLESNVGYVARARRRIEYKKNRTTVDADMVQLAGAAAISVARRNAILGAVPKPVWRRAQEAVESVIKGSTKTLVERRDAAVGYFNKAGVQTERILKALEIKHIDDITLDHLVDLQGMRSALKTGEASLDQLFPEEKALGPKPETLIDKLTVLTKVDPRTGEIKESGAAEDHLAPGGAGAASPPRNAAPASPAETVKVGQRGPKSARRAATLQERVKAEGDAAAAKGTHALNEWWESLSDDARGHISPAMDKTWQEVAAKAGSKKEEIAQ
jgi:hypothetical protein